MQSERPNVVALVLLFVLASACAPPSPARDEEKQEAAQRAIIDLERRGFAGSVLVAKDGEIRIHRHSGLDDDSSCVPSYWIASITKQFLAAGILLLQQRDMLNIQDSISTYLPSIPEEFSEITIFQLLTHTSGLRQLYAADGIADRDLALQALLVAEPQSAHGEQFSYANDNYNLLAIVLEVVSGVSYEEFLRAEILAPAGMKNSGFWGETVASGTCVPPVASQLEASALSPNWGFRGATGMRASVRDLYEFVESLQDPNFLSADSVALLMGNHLQLPSGTEVGFNWFGQYSDQGVYTRFSSGHESFGGNAVIYLYPQLSLMIITATNAGPAETGNGPIKGWSRSAHEALAEVYISE